VHVGACSLQIIASIHYTQLCLLFILHSSSEVLHYSCALDNLKLSEEHTNVFNGVKDKVMQQASNYRQEVHRRLNPGTIQTFVQTQRNAALGLAGGAFVGVLL
jgi:hypothetical protein